MRRHLSTRPSEDRLQFGDRRAGIRCSGRRDLADTMRRARHVGSAASGGEVGAESRLLQRPAASAYNRGKIAARSGLQCLGQYRQDRNGDDRPSLLRFDGRDPVSHMLAPEPHGIAATEASLRRLVEPHPLTCPDRPALLIGGNVFLGPSTDTGIATAGGGLDANGRIVLDELHLERPSKQRAHDIQKVLRLPGRMGSALQARSNCFWCYCRQRVLPAVSTTCRYSPFHLARVDSDRACHEAESWKHSMSHPNVPAVARADVTG